MQIFLHMWSLAKELLSKATSPYDLPQLAKEAGFQGIEWLDRLMPAYSTNSWEKLAKYQEKAGFNSSALSLCLEMTVGKDKVEEQVTRSLQIMDLCPLIGVRNIRVSVGGNQRSLARALLLLESLYPKKQRDLRPIGYLTQKAYFYSLFLPSIPKDRPISNFVEKELLRNTARALKPLAVKAKALDIRLGIENHFGITSIPDDLLELVELIGQGTGICLDLGNFSSNKQRMEACKQFLPKICHIHFKTYGQDPMDQSLKMNYPEIIKSIKQHNYKGVISVECEGGDSGLKAAQNGAELLKHIWNVA